MLRPVRLGGVWRHGLVAVALLATAFAGVRVFRPTEWALERAQSDYDLAWAGFPKAQLP